MVNDQKEVSIRLYGRGGQGVVTAANVLARAACIAGLWSQTYPFFGAERRGAPVTASVRISKHRIRSRYFNIRSDVVMILDHKLYDLIDIHQSVREGGIVIINTPFKIKGSDKYRVFYINAGEIVRKLGLFFAGWSLVNMPMLGAFSKVTGIVGLEHIIQSISEYLHSELLELNVKAVKIAYDDVYEAE
ncbi:MAG: 2-oxoacid:acceptor oxidoreductase family protein [Sulfolobales archaeon]